MEHLSETVRSASGLLRDITDDLYETDEIVIPIPLSSTTGIRLHEFVTNSTLCFDTEFLQAAFYLEIDGIRNAIEIELCLFGNKLVAEQIVRAKVGLHDKWLMHFFDESLNEEEQIARGLWYKMPRKECLAQFAAAGHLFVLQHYVSEYPDQDLPQNVVDESAKNGHIDCMVYANSHGSRWSAWTALLAVEGNQFETLIVLCKHGCQLYATERVRPCEEPDIIYRAVGQAVREGRVDILRFLVEQQGCPLSPNNLNQAYADYPYHNKEARLLCAQYMLSLGILPNARRGRLMMKNYFFSPSEIASTVNDGTCM